MVVSSDLSLQKVQKLLEANKILTRSLNLNEILQNLVQVAHDLINDPCVVILYLYDHETDKLSFAGGSGVQKEYLQHISFSPGESIAGKVFNRKQSKLFTSESEIDEYMRNMSPDNFEYYYKGVYQQKVKSSFVVPIMKKDHCYGLIIVNNFQKDGVFTKEDMKVVEVIADQSAIAIENAEMYKSLKEKNELLERSVSIHNKFYDVLIQGYGIERIIRLLEKMINAKVVFEQHQVDLESPYTFPIVRKDELLGSLKLSKPFEQFSYMDQIAIEQASLSIILEIIKNNIVFEKELHFREKMFKRMTENFSYSDLNHLLSYMDWGREWDYQCIVMKGKYTTLWKMNKLIEKERVVRNIEQILASHGCERFVFTRTNHLVMMIPNLDHQIKENILQKLKQVRPHIIVGIGRKTSIDQIDVSYREAMRSIELADYYDRSVIEYSLLGVERILYEVDDNILDLFISDQLKGLAKNNDSLLETLQTFIECHKNHQKTADQLHVHPNTLYYRLRKIEEILEIDLNNEQHWLDLVVAMKLFMDMHKNK